MARTRKTFNVEEFRQYVNGLLRDSTPELVEGRQAIASTLEHVLMETNNYHGFRYRDGTADETRREYL